ncbi:hypothetical protein FI667_g7261, partial [Globisporangium splendens]
MPNQVLQACSSVKTYPLHDANVEKRQHDAEKHEIVHDHQHVDATQLACRDEHKRLADRTEKRGSNSDPGAIGGSSLVIRNDDLCIFNAAEQHDVAHTYQEERDDGTRKDDHARIGQHHLRDGIECTCDGGKPSNRSIQQQRSNLRLYIQILTSEQNRSLTQHRWWKQSTHRSQFMIHAANERQKIASMDVIEYVSTLTNVGIKLTHTADAATAQSTSPPPQLSAAEDAIGAHSRRRTNEHSTDLFWSASVMCVHDDGEQRSQARVMVLMAVV